MVSGKVWLPALGQYLCAIIVGNLAWESGQLPLYTLWKTGTAGEIIYAVLHCTAGDVLIAGAGLVGSILVLGRGEWPSARFVAVATATLVSGVAVTAIIEHLSTTRGFWTYSALMPLLPGTGLGLAPLAQWIVIPALAFAFVWSRCPRRALTFPLW